MKKILNSKIFVFLFGVAFTSLSIVFAASYLASDIGFTSVDANWKASNVGSALDDLYAKECQSTPVGTILSYMGTTIPNFFLKCDGTVYNISDFPLLAEHIKTNFGSYNYFGGNGTTTFAVPDLRGEFLRGTGTNSHASQGSGESVGVHQDGTEHPGTYVADYGKGLYTSTFNQSMRPEKHDFAITGSNELNTVTGKYVTSSSYTSIVASYTSRPTNTSVLYLIRYK